MIKRGVILIGHGGVPVDYPRDRLMRLKALESSRLRSGDPISPEEEALDAEVRNWPRSPQTDPYQAGLEQLATRMRPLIDDIQLVIAYNEFCSPGLEEAVRSLSDLGADEIVVIPTMLTPGGIHSEVEIPETIKSLQKSYPGINFQYLWPFDLDQVAQMFVQQLFKRQTKPS